MSVHYLTDPFANPLASSKIIDTKQATLGASVTNGAFVVRVPDGIRLSATPVDLVDLLSKKYQGLLAFYAGFTTIFYDPLMDTTDLNLAYAGTKGFFGERGTVKLSPGGAVQSVNVPLGSSPTQAIVTWEVFQYAEVDPTYGLLERTYTEVSAPPGNTTCEVSFDNGVTFTATTDGSVLNIPVLAQGPNFRIRLTNAAADPLFIGSWALIF